MNLRVLPFVLVAVFTLSFTQKIQDDCKPYFPMSKGTTWVYNEYDKNGELSGTNTTLVQSVVSSANRIEYKLKATSDGPKMKEKNHHETEFEYICENGVFKMNLENFVPKETMESFGEEATVNITQSEMEFPSTMNAGDKLNDASITVSVEMSGMNVMNMTVNITDRKVEKIEDVTTAAGTYNCALLTYNVSSKMGFVNTSSSAKDWFSTEVGIVKSETYDKNGSLQGSRELISFTAGE